MSKGQLYGIFGHWHLELNIYSETEQNTSINVAWDFAGPVYTVPKSQGFALLDFTANIIVSGPELDAPPIARVLNMICNFLYSYVLESDA